MYSVFHFVCLFSRWKRADQTEKEDCSSESHYSKNPTSQEKICHSGVRPCNIWSVFVSSSLNLVWFEVLVHCF